MVLGADNFINERKFLMALGCFFSNLFFFLLLRKDAARRDDHAYAMTDKKRATR